MPRVVTMAEYATLPRANITWVANNLIPKPSIILLLGQEKVGKSFLALDVGQHISQGLPVWDNDGFKVEMPMRVLYLQFDTSEAIWRKRLSDLMDTGYELKIPNFIMVHPEDMMLPFDILTARGEDWLVSIMREHEPDVVIIDVLREIHTRDENDSREMKLVGDALTRHFKDKTLILVHHTRKQSTDPRSTQVSIGQLARGSSYAAGKVDSIWYLQEDKLSIVNRFDHSKTYVTRRQDNGIWSVVT